MPAVQLRLGLTLVPPRGDDDTMKAIESTWMNDEFHVLNESVSGFFVRG